MRAPPNDAAVMPRTTPENCAGPSKGEDCFRRGFRAEPFAVRDARRAAVARFARRMGPDDAGALELTLAEVLNNIVEHAYAGRAPGQVSVSLMLASAGDALLCRVEDDGHPMPGMALPEGQMQPVAERIEDLAEGGWGWALIRTLTDEIVYERQAGRNRLHFRLPLSKAS